MVRHTDHLPGTDLLGGLKQKANNREVSCPRSHSPARFTVRPFINPWSIYFSNSAEAMLFSQEAEDFPASPHLSHNAKHSDGQQGRPSIFSPVGSVQAPNY